MSLSYLLDTCVVSEFVKPKPDKNVLSWLNSMDAERIYLSVVTLGEVQQGISNLPRSNRRAELEEWLNEQLTAQFAGRILALDAATFITWGQLIAPLKQQGRTMSVMDSLIAATAVHHRMTLVTRNVSDFQHVELGIFNPWQ
jgi:predicted nucleic acid-binding protein